MAHPSLSRLLDQDAFPAIASKRQYERKLEALQRRMLVIQQGIFHARRRAIIAIEGFDAAGKGGAIRRLTEGVDPRGMKVVPIGPPTEDEQGRHWLYRFWRELPPPGDITVFDRTWYGRVLVERVEGFCTEADWMRAYSEICQFEEQLITHRVIVLKFWLAISKAEQLRRFKAREEIAFKKFKITEEDWRNRKKWDAYEEAVCDMVERTSTEIAPWTLVEANNKYFARIKVIKTLVKKLERVLEG